MSKRVTQLTQEVIRSASLPPRKVTQETIEVIRKPSSRYARATLYVIEVLRKNESDVVLNQQPIISIVC